MLISKWGALNSGIFPSLTLYVCSADIGSAELVLMDLCSAIIYGSNAEFAFYHHCQQVILDCLLFNLVIDTYCILGLNSSYCYLIFTSNCLVKLIWILIWILGKTYLDILDTSHQEYLKCRCSKAELPKYL